MGKPLAFISSNEFPPRVGVRDHDVIGLRHFSHRKRKTKTVSSTMALVIESNNTLWGGEGPRFADRAEEKNYCGKIRFPLIFHLGLRLIR